MCIKYVCLALQAEEQGGIVFVVRLIYGLILDS